MQHQGDGADGLHVVRHHVAPHSVSAGYGLHQLAVFVGQRDGGAIVFQFAADLEFLAFQSLADTLVEVRHLAL